jgi:haloalkane dehalogenase
MKFIEPETGELAHLRADPLLVEQELDARPYVAEAIETETGLRAGRRYWRSTHDHLYGLELGDTGHVFASMATVYGFWDRFEPRPPEHEIDADLLEFCLWLADVSAMNPTDVARAARFANVQTTWPEGSVLYTPEERFGDLPDFPYEPKYIEVEGIRMAYVEAGSGDPILLLHGEPTWSFLYRHMIPELTAAGRVIAPDLIGFGRSGKPATNNAYTYKSHVRWVRKFIESLGLERITLVCQDWGGLIGIRVLSQIPERFARLIAMNTGLPVGHGASEAFLKWRRFSQNVDMLEIGKLVGATLTRRVLTHAERAAYDAPFPSKEYQTGALVFPRLVPTRIDQPGSYENQLAIERLKQLELPVLLPWGDADPITAPSEPHLRSIFKNVAPPLPIAGAGHFIQEDAGEEVAGHIVRWMRG